MHICRKQCEVIQKNQWKGRRAQNFRCSVLQENTRSSVLPNKKHLENARFSKNFNIMTYSVGNHVEQHAQGFPKIITYWGGLYLTVSYGPLNSTQFCERISTKKSKAKTFTNWFCHTKWGNSPLLPLVFCGAYLHKTMKIHAFQLNFPNIQNTF